MQKRSNRVMRLALWKLASLLLIQSAALASTLTSDQPVMIFLSFSLPETTLSQYFSQGKTYHAPLMIRGLVNDSFQDTQTAVMRFAKANNSGVVLDPRWFERYHITQVPAILLQDSSSASQPYAIVYGTLSVRDAVSYLAEHENPVQALAAQLLATPDEPS